MNIVCIKYFFVGFMVYEKYLRYTESIRIRALSVFGYFPLYIYNRETSLLKEIQLWSFVKIHVLYL